MIKLLRLPKELEASRIASGSFCYILAGEGIEQFLFDRYGRRGLCLKVFDKPDGNAVELLDVKPIVEISRIQNLFALFGLAPVVYRIVLLDNIRRLAQVVEYGQDKGEADPYLARKLVEEFGLRSVNRTPEDGEKWDFLSVGNWVGGQFVDFGGWYFQ